MQSYLEGIACPSSTTCYAVGGGSSGGGVVVSITGGSPSGAVAVSGTSFLQGIACLSSTTCYAVGGGSSGGGVVVSITSGGFGGAVAVSGAQGFGGIACPNSATCYAVGQSSSGQGAVVPITSGSPGGATTVSGTSFLEGIACPDTTDCYAVGAQQTSPSTSTGVIVPITSGSPGSSLTVTGTSFLQGIACASSTTCYAAGTAGQSPSTQGVLVTVSQAGSAPGAPAVSGISPASGPTSGGTSVTITGTGFTGATAVAFGSGVLTAPGCPTPASGQFCVNSDSQITTVSPAGTGAVDVTVTTPSGTSATGSADQFSYGTPPGAPAVSGISPGSAMAGSSNLALTINGSNFVAGATVQLTSPSGTTSSLTPGSVLPSSLSVIIPSVTIGTWYVLVVNPSPGGGASNAWPLYVLPGPVTVQNVPGTPETLYSIACPGSTVCYAAGGGGSGGSVVAITSGSPGSGSGVPGTTVLYGVDCASSGVCYAAGVANNGLGTVVSITNGNPGSPIPSGTGTLNGVACASSTTCYAVGIGSSGGVVVPIVNGSIGSAASVTGTYAFYGIACPSSTTCYAAGVNSSGTSGAVVTITNGNPGAPAVVSGTTLNGIACSNSTTCYAVGQEQTAPYTYTGAVLPITNGNPGSPIPSGTGQLVGIACLTGSSTCDAVGENVVPITNGTVGSVLPVSGAGGLDGIACPSSTTCYAVGASSSGQGAIASITGGVSVTGEAVTTSGSATLGGVSASASGGSGTISVAQYSGNPSGANTAFQAQGSYYDVSLAPGSTYTSLAITFCGLTSSDQVMWYNPSASAWQPVSPQSFSSSACGGSGGIVFTASGTSTPALSQLVGSFFVGALTDTTPPVVSVSFPATGGSGWYTTSPVTGTVTANDTTTGGSNVTAIICTGATVGTITALGTPSASAPLSVSTQGANSVSCTATDSAGNTGAGPGSSNTATVKLDSVAPAVSLDSAHDTCDTPGSNGWCRGKQTAGFNATDATSGVATPCTAAPAASCSFTQSTTTNGSAVSIPSGAVTDVAGNSNPGINAGLYKIDSVPPTLAPTLSSTIPCPSLLTGLCVLLNASVTASPNATDATSGVATQGCGSVVTSSVGPHSVSCTATDNAGNAGNATLNYTVIYEPAGTTCLGAPGHAILPPISADGSSVFKQGSTVPAKFRVCDASGNSIGTAGVVTKFALIGTTSGNVGGVNETVSSTTPDAAFRWDATNQQWIFNISTTGLTSGSTYTYLVTLNDGTTIQFSFGLN